MISTESIMAIDKSDIQAASKALAKDDLPQLVEWLSLKDDNIRYQALLLLQSRSMFFDDVYPFWDTFREKLKSDNSYQRSIGLMLVAENTKWDAQNRMEETIDEYLTLLNDEKPITIRPVSYTHLDVYKRQHRKLEPYSSKSACNVNVRMGT